MVSDPQGSAYIHYLSAGTATASYHLQLLYMVVKLKLESSCLQDMHSMVGVINPGLFLTFFFLSKNPHTIFHMSFTCFHFLHTHVSIYDDAPCFVWPFWQRMTLGKPLMACERTEQSSHQQRSRQSQGQNLVSAPSYDLPRLSWRMQLHLVQPQTNGAVPSS